MLRDGASAQYGSDAIAGVINIVLKGSDDGGSVGATLRPVQRRRRRAVPAWRGDAGFKLGDDGFLHLAAQGGAPGPDRSRAAVISLGVTADADLAPPLGRVVQR